MLKRSWIRSWGMVLAVSLAACAPVAVPAQPIPATFTAMPSPTALSEPAGSTVEPATAIPVVATATPKRRSRLDQPADHHQHARHRRRRARGHPAFDPG